MKPPKCQTNFKCHRQVKRSSPSSTTCGDKHKGKHTNVNVGEIYHPHDIRVYCLSP